MIDDLSYGWRTAILSVAVAQLIVLAAALVRSVENRIANRVLAALLIVAAGVVTPWMIGFAGFYDKWRWLSFAPVSITLAIAPLFYFYVHALTQTRAPKKSWLHLSPAIVQFTYLSICFVALRQPQKNEWLGMQAEVYGAVTGAGVIAGCVFYGVASQRLLRAYRAALAGERSDDHRFAAAWISRSIAAFATFLGLYVIYGVWDAVSPLGYRGFMGLFIGVAAIALYLGAEGWRHAALRFPRLREADAPQPQESTVRDWAEQGAAWAADVRRGGWHADPALSISDLANRLGTNSNYLSRALNEGLGVNFSAFINGLRSEDVADAIRGGDRRDLLTIALDAGFSSKATFNRAFAARFGMSPSAFRRANASKPE